MKSQDRNGPCSGIGFSEMTEPQFRPRRKRGFVSQTVTGRSRWRNLAVMTGWASLVFVLLAWLSAGCATAPRLGSPVTLYATGESGVTVRVQSSSPGVPEQVAGVPAELQYHGSSYDLRCVHGPQAGRLTLIARRNGFSISTGDTTRPGEVTVFRIRPDEISVRVELAEK